MSKPGYSVIYDIWTRLSCHKHVLEVCGASKSLWCVVLRQSLGGVCPWQGILVTVGSFWAETLVWNKSNYAGRKPLWKWFSQVSYSAKTLTFMFMLWKIRYLAITALRKEKVLHLTIGGSVRHMPLNLPLKSRFQAWIWINTCVNMATKKE